MLSRLIVGIDLDEERANRFLSRCRPRELGTQGTVFHQLDLVAIRVRDPGLARIIHAQGDLAHCYAFVLQLLAEFTQPGDLQTEVPVARAVGQFLNFPAPDFRSHLLVEEFQKGGVATAKVISEGLILLIVQRELNLYAKLIHIEVDDPWKIIGREVEMGKLSYHGFLH